MSAESAESAAGAERARIESGATMGRGCELPAVAAFRRVSSRARMLGLRAIVCALLLLGASSAGASLILQTSVAQMWAGSELVFEGRVLEIWPQRDARSGGIDTWVRFEVRSVLKGRWASKTLALRFMGGELDGLRDEVAGLRLPALDEHGIYFVESLKHFQVNPLFGWDQGRLRIVRDGRGAERVVSADGDPILGMGEALRAPGGLRSRGVADGLRVDAAARLEDAISPRALAVELRARLGGPMP